MTATWIFITGLVLGFPIGVMFDDALDLYRASRGKDIPVRLPSGRTLLSWGLAMVLALNLAVGVLLIQTRVTAERTAEELAAYSVCVSSWQQDFATAYKARYAASVPVSDALDEIVQAVETGDTGRMRAAIADYLRVRDAQTMERDQNPLPPLPEQLCGTAPKATS